MIELQPKKGAPGGEPEPPNSSRSILNFEANADASAMSNLRRQCGKGLVAEAVELLRR